jgi:uncharacterized protein
MSTLRFRRLAALPACLALLVAGTLVQARAVKSDSVVKVTASATRLDAGGNQVVTLNLDVEKPWHLYANPVGNEDLTDAATVVTVGAREKPEAVKVEYPEGKLEKDKAIGDYKIYEGKVTIKAQVRRAKGDTSPLEVSIKVQACSKSPDGKDGGKCLEPATIKVQVP